MKAQMQKGFTLIELMIVVAIIGILAAIAVPQYSDYTSRTRAAGTVAEIASIKTAVSMCIAETGKIAGCDSGAHGIPTDFLETSNTNDDVAVTDGVITGTSKATDTAGADLAFTLEPTLDDDSANMVWEMEATSTLCDSKRGLKPGQGGCPL